MAAKAGNVQSTQSFKAKVLEDGEWKPRTVLCVVQNDVQVDCHDPKCGPNFKVAPRPPGGPLLIMSKNDGITRVVSMEDFLGIESGASICGEISTLTVVCASQTIVFSFFHEETSLLLETWLRSFLGFGCCFSCTILTAPTRSGLQTGQYVRLHLLDERFCLVSGAPAVVVDRFEMDSLESFGAIRNKFCFQVKSGHQRNSCCYVLCTTQSRHIDFLLQLACKNLLHAYLLHAALKRARDADSSTTYTFLCNAYDDDSGRGGPPFRSPPIVRRLAASNVEDHFKLPKPQRDALVRKYSDSQLPSCNRERRCHRCVQHKYVNQSFIDSLEYYHNCRSHPGHARSRDCIHLDGVDHHHCAAELVPLNDGKVLAAGSQFFKKSRFFGKRQKKVHSNNKQRRGAQTDGRMGVNRLQEWLKRSIDPRGRKAAAAAFSNGNSDSASKTIAAANDNVPTAAAAVVPKQEESIAAELIQYADLPEMVREPENANCGQRSQLYRHLDVKLNTSAARRQLRSTMRTEISGNFNCYDGFGAEEVMASCLRTVTDSNLVDRQPPLSAPLVANSRTNHFDFIPSSTEGGNVDLKYCEVAGKERSARVKSSSLPCQTSRRQSNDASQSGYAKIDKAATLAAGKLAMLRAEELTDRWSSVLMLNEGVAQHPRRKESLLSWSAVDFLPD